MILQRVFSIFPCSPLPSGTCRTPGLSIPYVVFPPLPLSALSSSPFHCALQDGFGQTWWTGNMTIPLQFASFYDRQGIFMWSNCLLDLAPTKGFSNWLRLPSEFWLQTNCGHEHARCTLGKCKMNATCHITADYNLPDKITVTQSMLLSIYVPRISKNNFIQSLSLFLSLSLSLSHTHTHTHTHTNTDTLNYIYFFYC